MNSLSLPLSLALSLSSNQKHKRQKPCKMNEIMGSVGKTIMLSMVATSESRTQPATAPAAAGPDDAPAQMVFRSRLPDLPTLSNHLPIHAYVFENLPSHASSPCLISAATGRVYTHAETHLLARRAAALLSRRFRISKGDVVMILLHNCPEFALSYLACSFLGAVSTAANPFSTPAELAKHIRASGARLVITSPAYASKLPDFIPILDFSEIDHSSAAAADEDSISLPEEAEIGPEDPIAMPFSSGTTGLPKGVVLTHRNVVSGIAQQVDGENPNLYLKGGEDVLLCVLPLFHIFSMNSVLLTGIRAGAAVVMMGRFEMEGMLAAIERWRVTVAAVVPPMVLAMAKSPAIENYDLGSVRIVLSGAAPLGKELAAKLMGRLPQAVLGQGYGMTEAGPVISMCPGFAKHPTGAKSDSCGTVVRNAELKVIDPESGLSLGRNQRGEICVRGPQIMKGYLNAPEATAATIDVEGWLHTGDIGYVDDDDEVFIVDRVKELIKYKGFQVPPAELEDLLNSHPSIADAAVIPQIDEVAGEVPVAFVVLSQDCELTEDSIKEFISKQVVFYKRLHKVYFVHSIPKSPSGKILRKDLRARVAAATAAAATVS